MNSYFDLNRWFLYISKHWNENKKKYLISLAAIGGLLVLWFSFLMIVNRRHPMQEDMQVVAYYVGLYLTGCLYASMIFQELSDSSKGISYLLLPASLLEKLLTAILFGVVLYFVCYTVVFYAVDFIMVKASNGIVSNIYEKEHLGRFTPQEVANVFVTTRVNGDNFYIIILLIYFTVQSIFLLGSVYFSKYSYIKTLVWGLIVFLVLVFFQHKIIASFMPHGGFFNSTVYRVFDHEKGELNINIPAWIGIVGLYLIKYSLPPLLWIASYFRLKEKEV
ncbi:hypothetical protein [Niastella populi]|uniref:Uncharacterized protein n=1 Tax=Niastella populi TaxID=550983 RepID=A0A1V9G816_9BACT|nr:hypothetical protein [Niastella populi]OQP66722.1 hypothetical protein A4R26_13195 [Niastella populi]